MRLALPVVAIVAALSCGCGGPSAIAPEDFGTRLITFPNGKSVRAEQMMRPEDVQRGMMFRDSLAPERGMLFLHGQEAAVPYWMFNVRIPLDIIWIDAQRRIVEIVPNAAPCLKPAGECPSYGGKRPALYVLELAGGVAAKNGLAEGQTLDF